MTSRLVLTETERNVREKLHDYHLERFFMLVSKIKILKQFPDDQLIAKAKKAIAEKDAVILAEVKQAKTNILVTLDRKHFLNPKVAKFLKPQKALTPKMIIEIIESR